MLINEMKMDFYKTASKEQIHRLVESRNNTGISNEILTEVIHAANHEELWETMTSDQLEQHIMRMLNGSGKQ
jgi:hypothetical protein